jgi:hypothetical protein
VSTLKTLPQSKSSKNVTNHKTIKNKDDNKDEEDD